MTGAPFAPTRDLNQARRDLDVHGFCIIDGALTHQEVDTAKARIVAQAKAEQARGVAFRDGGLRQDLLDANGRFRDKASIEKDGGVNQRVFMLVAKGGVFRDLVIHPTVDLLVSHLLGDDFLLSTMSANIVRAGCVRMGLHTDQWWMPQPARPDADYRRPGSISRHPAPEFLVPDKRLGIAPPVAVTAVWMLTDFTSRSGATELVPGSHLSGGYPAREGQERYNIVQPQAAAGCLMVFDGRIWHGNGANIDQPDRIGILATYCAPQFRQQENMTLALKEAMWSEMPDKLKERLGYKVWNGYGRVEAEFGSFVTPHSAPYGEL